MAYTLDEFVKLNKNYTKGYDTKTKQANVTNKDTGKSISFKSGMGSDYGLGGLENDSNTITDINKFSSFFKADEPIKPMSAPEAPIGTAVTSQSPMNEYTSPYSQNITDTLAALSNRPAFSYNAENDQGLKAAQNNAMSAVNREAARRGMVYSDSNKSQLGQSSLALIPQFEQAAFAKDQQDVSNLTNRINTLSNLESQNYNKFNSNRQAGMQEAGLTGMYNGSQTMAGQNNALSQEQLRNENYMSTINQYGQDYQAEINKITNDGDPSNDWQIPLLSSTRQNKISSNNAAEQERMSQQEAQAYEMFDRLGYATPEVSQLTGIPEGATTLDYQQVMSKINLDMRKQTVDEAQAQIDNAIKRGQLSVSQGNLALSRAKFKAETEADSLDNGLSNITKQLEKNFPKMGTSDFDRNRASQWLESQSGVYGQDVIDYIKNNYNLSGSNSGGYNISDNYGDDPQFTMDTIQKQFDAGFITEEEAIDMAQKAGLGDMLN